MIGTPALTPGQRQALDELTRIASGTRGLQIVNERVAGELLLVEISIDCSNIEHAPAGVRLRARERLFVTIAPDFPFSVPVVEASHTRWAGTPHVQWGRHLCLYVSPATEWDPTDGMAGFIERLVLWLERAGVGQLDGIGEPLHPPVAYPSTAAGHVVVRANAPRSDGQNPWLGVALLHRRGDDRVDVVSWLSLTDPWPSTLADARVAAGFPVNSEADILFGFAVVLPRAIAFEYPATASELLKALKGYGLDEPVLLGLLGFVCGINRELAGLPPTPGPDGLRPPLYFFIGTPSRGIAGDPERITHFAAWLLPDIAGDIARLVQHRHSTVAELAAIGEEVLQIGRTWIDGASTAWARVHEARSEVVVSRDHQTSAAWLVGKRVLILGAGALGAPIAEACVRGRASRVVVGDRGIVHPGILVRQPYNDEDIGQEKALVLAERLRRIDPAVDVQSMVGDVAGLFDADTGAPDFDVVIDATANRIVRTLIERHRGAHRDAWPPLATVLLGHDATRGIAAISPRVASGGGADILRRLSLAGRGYAADDLDDDVVDDFFPDPPRTQFFQPEPGCSEATFVGSAADVTGLAGQLLAGVLHALRANEDNSSMRALVVRMPQSPGAARAPSTCWFTWPSDTVVVGGDYEIRLSAPAVAEMRAEARRGARTRGGNVETGGTLLGAVDTAAGVVWVDEATGPPPDSRLSETHFEHGVQGVEELITARSSATARVTTFVGMWHSHPYGKAHPSPRDRDGMHDLVLPIANAPPRALLLILGGARDRWESWLEQSTAPDWFACVIVRQAGAAPAPRSTRAPDGGVRWWSGAWLPPKRPPRRGRARRWLRLRRSKRVEGR